MRPPRNGKAPGLLQKPRSYLQRFTQFGRGMGRLLGCKAPWLQGPRSYPHLIRERNGKAPGLPSLHPPRQRNGTAPGLHQQGPEEWEGSWAASTGAQIIFIERGRRMESPELHLEGPSSYPHPIREKNGKAAGLHRLLSQGHRSYPHPSRERIRRLLGCSGCFHKGTDHILTQLGRGSEGSWTAFGRAPNHILTQ